MSTVIEIPANLVVDALAGRQSLIEAFGMREEDHVRKILEEGWSISSCHMIKGNIEAGEAQKVVLELTPPAFAVFGGKKG